ncbi:MAG: hypothetical protein H3C68_05895 [Deltaproteobacteria bacterium]|nr:hypothetical protein [Deltaproteobacteria bacterium]MBZ0220261.1 hypothetical protein [Deltaproteobacteria bacterium]
MLNGKEEGFNRLIFALALVMAVIFFASIFRHLSYPLLWNDEGDTAMFATRILEYGYPKVHDGKNILHVHPVTDIDLVVNKKWDMYTADTIMTYYWAVPGAWLAAKAEDIYSKTFLFRAPFAATGFIGVLIMGLTAASLLERGRPGKPLILALFFLFATLSVSLALHLKDARSYSPVMLLSAGVLYFYINHRVLERLSFRLHTSALVILLLCIYHNFYPLYIVFLAFLGLYESIRLIGKCLENRRIGRAFAMPGIRDFKYFVPIILSVISIVPFVIAFKTIQLIMAGSAAGNSSYLRNLAFIFGYFIRHEFLFLAFFVKSVLVFMLIRCRLSGTSLFESVARKVRVSNFLTLFFVVHVFVIAGTPWIYTRYFIVLQPVLTMILLLDAFVVFEVLAKAVREPVRNRWRAAFIAAAAVIFVLVTAGKYEDLKGRVYELTHQYKGPLDFVVPFIKENYENPEDLVIATNVEEASLMYYLGSKVIIGFIWNNIVEDLKLTPDIIFYRSYWGGWEVRSLFERRLLPKAAYWPVSFPVQDYPINNIPDIHFRIRHLYRTPAAENEAERLRIFVRK